MRKLILICPIILLGCFLAWPGLAVDKVKGVKVKKIKSNTAKVIWSEVDNATSYVVKVRRKKNKKLVDTVKTTATSAWVDLPKKKKYYRVKVRAKDSNKNKGRWSKAKLFKSKGWRYYHNKKYDFSMKFPKGWKDFRVKKVISSSGISYEFKLYSSEMNYWYDMFMITIMTPQQYQDQEYIFSEIITEDDDYVYTWMHAQDTASDLYMRARETDEIINSFALD